MRVFTLAVLFLGVSSIDALAVQQTPTRSLPAQQQTIPSGEAPLASIPPNDVHQLSLHPLASQPAFEQRLGEESNAWDERGIGWNETTPYDIDEQRYTHLEQSHLELLERLESLEKQLDETHKELDRRISFGGVTNSMKVDGRIHLDYWSFPHSSEGINRLETGNENVSPQDRFGFRRARIGVKGDLASNMVYRINVEFAEANSPEIKDGYLGWRDLPFLQNLYVGNQKRPYSLDQLNSSNTNVFLERPFIADVFNPNARRLAIIASGASQDLRYNWAYGVMNLREIADDGTYISDHYQLEVAGRLASTCWYDEVSEGRGYAHCAVSASSAYPDGSVGIGSIAGLGRTRNESRFRSRYSTRHLSSWLDTWFIDNADNQQFLGWEGVLNFGSLQVGGEYSNMWVNRDPGTGSQIRMHGGYAYASYILTGEHIQWNRSNGTIDRVEPFEPFFLVRRQDGCLDRGWGAWQVAVRYDAIDLNDDDIFGGVAHSWTGALNWYWTAHAKLQMNYVWGDLEGRDANNILGGAPNILGGEFSSIGVRAMIDY